MDADELIKEFLSEHVDQVHTQQPNWQFYIDPRTGKKVWYDEDKMWELLGSHNDPSTDTKSPFKTGQHTLTAVGTPALRRGNVMIYSLFAFLLT